MNEQPDPAELKTLAELGEAFSSLVHVLSGGGTVRLNFERIIGLAARDIQVEAMP